ncbi:hypothetical protein QTN25_004081 [Entamoeba marina]
MRTQQENTYFSDLDKQFNKRLIETVAKKSDKLSKSIDDIITHFLEVDNSDPQQHKHKLKEYNEIIKGNNETVLGQYETMYDKFQKAIVNKDAAIKKFVEKEIKVNDEAKFIFNQLAYRIIEIKQRIFASKHRPFEEDYFSKTNDHFNKMEELLNQQQSYNTYDHQVFSTIAIEERVPDLSHSIRKIKEWKKSAYAFIWHGNDNGIYGFGSGTDILYDPENYCSSYYYQPTYKYQSNLPPFAKNPKFKIKRLIVIQLTNKID